MSTNAQSGASDALLFQKIRGLVERSFAAPSEQLTIPGFHPRPEPEEVMYYCECGASAFMIREDWIECAACGVRYYDGAMPVDEFNQHRKQLVCGRGERPGANPPPIVSRPIPAEVPA